MLLSGCLCTLAQTSGTACPAPLRRSAQFVSACLQLTNFRTELCIRMCTLANILFVLIVWDCSPCLCKLAQTRSSLQKPARHLFA
jgi:hypothetical protein